MGKPTSGGLARGLGGAIAVLATGAALVALGAAPASAAFSRGGLLDGGFDVCCPQVASDADGDAIAVWIHPTSRATGWSRARFRPHANAGR